jgi:hypothetical protein
MVAFLAVGTLSNWVCTLLYLPLGNASRQGEQSP